MHSFLKVFVRRPLILSDDNSYAFVTRRRVLSLEALCFLVVFLGVFSKDRSTQPSRTTAKATNFSRPSGRILARHSEFFLVFFIWHFTRGVGWDPPCPPRDDLMRASVKWDIISCGYALTYAYIHTADIMHMTRPSRVCDSRQVPHVSV